MHNFIEVYSNSVPDSLIDRLISKVDLDHEVAKDVGRVAKDGGSDNKYSWDLGETQFSSNKLLREDFQVFLLEADPELYHEVLDTITPYVKAYASKYSMSMEALALQRVKVQKTPEYGGYSFWHSEQGKSPSNTRALSWVLYLNDIEEAGETEFIFQQVRQKPVKGELVVFPAGLTHVHRGNPPVGATKYIATGWAVYE